MPPFTYITAPQQLRTEPITTARIRLRIPRTGMQQLLPPALQELFGTLAAQGITPIGPWFAHHIELPTDHFHFDASVPVEPTVQPTGRVEPGHIPAMTIVRTLYRGPYTHLPEAWGEFRAWALAQNLPTAPEIIERYITNPNDTPDPAALQTELVWPLLTSELNRGSTRMDADQTQ